MVSECPSEFYHTHVRLGRASDLSFGWGETTVGHAIRRLDYRRGNAGFGSCKQSQSYEHAHFLIRMVQACWIPIFKAMKLILAGDPMQLPPTVLSVDDRSKKKKELTKEPSSKPINAKKSSESQLKTTPTTPEDITSLSEGSSNEDESDKGDGALALGPTPSKDKKTVTKNVPLLRPPRTLETTLFDRLEKMYGSRTKRMLTVQYRFVPIIYIRSSY